MPDTIGPCPAPIPAEIVARALAARALLTASLPAVRGALDELREAMSALTIYECDHPPLRDDDKLVEWRTSVLEPAHELHYETDDGWWDNEEARIAELLSGIASDPL